MSGQGLGLLLLRPLPGDRGGLGFELSPIPEVDRLAARARWAGAPPAPPLDLPPRELVQTPGLEPLVADGAGRVLAARRAQGRGAVAVSLLEDSFRWVLEGSAAVHGGFWSHLVEQLAKPLAAPAWRLPEGPIGSTSRYGFCSRSMPSRQIGLRWLFCRMRAAGPRCPYAKIRRSRIVGRQRFGRVKPAGTRC